MVSTTTSAFALFVSLYPTITLSFIDFIPNVYIFCPSTCCSVKSILHIVNFFLSSWLSPLYILSDIYFCVSSLVFTFLPFFLPYFAVKPSAFNIFLILRSDILTLSFFSSIWIILLPKLPKCSTNFFLTASISLVSILSFFSCFNW